jgi:hypothetical protein
MRLAVWVRPFLILCVSFVSVAWMATILFQLFARTLILFGTILPVALLAFAIAWLRSLPRDFLARQKRKSGTWPNWWMHRGSNGRATLTTAQADIDRSREGHERAPWADAAEHDAWRLRSGARWSARAQHAAAKSPSTVQDQHRALCRVCAQHRQRSIRVCPGARTDPRAAPRRPVPEWIPRRCRCLRPPSSGGWFSA